MPVWKCVAQMEGDDEITVGLKVYTRTGTAQNVRAQVRKEVEVTTKPVVGVAAVVAGIKAL